MNVIHLIQAIRRYRNLTRPLRKLKRSYRAQLRAEGKTSAQIDAAFREIEVQADAAIHSETAYLN